MQSGEKNGDGVAKLNLYGFPVFVGFGKKGSVLLCCIVVILLGRIAYIVIKCEHRSKGRWINQRESNRQILYILLHM